MRRAAAAPGVACLSLRPANLRHDRHHGVARDREAQADISSGAARPGRRIDGGIDADYLTARVQQGSAGVARVDGRVRLDGVARHGPGLTLRRHLRPISTTAGRAFATTSCTLPWTFAAAAAVVVVTAGLSALTTSPPATPSREAAAIAVAAALALVAAWSRMYLGVHQPTDVGTSMVLVPMVSWATAGVIATLRERRESDAELV